MKVRLGQKIYIVDDSFTLDPYIQTATVEFVGKEGFIYEESHDFTIRDLYISFEDFNRVWFLSLNKAKKRANELWGNIAWVKNRVGDYVSSESFVRQADKLR